MENAMSTKELRLQFGHGCDAVEIKTHRETFRRSTRSFNSATAVMPWRWCRLGFDSTVPSLLQFGHGCDAVEIRFEPFRFYPQSTSFNSATAVMPWRYRRLRSPGERQEKASIRPRL